MFGDDAPEGFPQASRDARRRPSIEDRRELYVRAGGRCQRCGDPLGDDWENAHLVAWSRGGATTLTNMEAWCLPCNRSQGAENAIDIPGFRLREWQEQALEVAMEQIGRRGSATIHAAPGAGKTRFTAAVYRRMRAAGWAERLVVVVPNSALRSQWRESLSEMDVHLDDEPRDNWIEHPRTDGPVITYHSLPNAASAHRAEIERRPTLVVLDEVHHAGDKATWGRAVRQMVGDVEGEVAAAGILNLTGTLFRSTGSKRISTVRYRRAEADPDKFEAIEDYSVRTAQLVPEYLRPPNVYTYGTSVRLLDTSTTEIVEGDLTDLDELQKSAVLRESWSSQDWVDGFVAEAVRMLNLQQEVVGRREPLKLLYVAANQQAAKRAANTLNRLTNQNFARLVISDEPAADRILRKAAKERTSLAIVSVRMVTEGFDCPAVSTIAYASNVVADLTIAQTMARAMRITATERNLGKVVPAQILIPDHAALKNAFTQALVGRMHLINDESDEERRERERQGIGSGEINRPRYQVVDLTTPVLSGATVVGAPDGEVSAEELTLWNEQLAARGVPLTYTPNIAVAARQIPQFPRIYSEAPESESPSRVPADPRTANKLRRKRIDALAKWMAGHIEHDDRWEKPGWFQRDANDFAGIPTGGRDRASEIELGMVEAWMTEKIIEHCNRQNCIPPPIFNEE